MSGKERDSKVREIEIEGERERINDISFRVFLWLCTQALVNVYN